MANCDDALSLPIVGCDDCSAFEARIKQLEELMEGAVQAITELQETVEDLQNQIDNKQDKLTAGDGITIEDNVISVTPQKQITFTITPTTVCDAVVCESVVCSSVSVDASAEDIVADMENHNARNMVLKVGDATYIPTSFKIDNKIMNLYHVTFNDGDGEYYITGDNESIEFIYR